MEEEIKKEIRELEIEIQKHNHAIYCCEKVIKEYKKMLEGKKWFNSESKPS